MTMKAMTFQDDTLSFQSDNFKDHYVLVFELTSMQIAPGNSHYPELVGGPLRPELNFTFPLEDVTEMIVLEGRNSLAAVDEFSCCWNEYINWIKFLSNK